MLVYSFIGMNPPHWLRLVEWVASGMTSNLRMRALSVLSCFVQKDSYCHDDDVVVGASLRKSHMCFQLATTLSPAAAKVFFGQLMFCTIQETNCTLYRADNDHGMASLNASRDPPRQIVAQASTVVERTV